jgi:hypothetical protein
MTTRHEQMTLPRRRFLRTLGAGTALWPFIPALDRFAEAQPRVGSPRRFVAWYYFLGTWPPAFWPTDPDSPTGSEVLAALDPVKSHVLPMRGLNMTTFGGGPPHFNGCLGAFTASYYENKLVGLGPAAKDPAVAGKGTSLDQYLGERIGTATPFAKLTLTAKPGKGPDSGSDEVPTRLAYKAVQAEGDPKAVFDRLFSNLRVAASPDLDRIRDERRSVIDLVRADLQALAPRLGAGERYKVEQHLAGLRETERRLQDVRIPGVGCQPPSLDPGATATGAAGSPARARALLDIVAAAFSCDLVRSVSLHMGFNELPWLSMSNYHGDSHGPPPPGNTGWVKAATRISAWQYGQVSYLAQKLAAMREGGGSVLDNTVILTGSDVAEGNAHTYKDIPYVIVGRGGGFFKTGRFLQLPTQGTNRLFTSICHAMGFDDVTRYGDIDRDKGQGPLTALSA